MLADVFYEHMTGEFKYDIACLNFKHQIVPFLIFFSFLNFKIQI